MRRVSIFIFGLLFLGFAACDRQDVAHDALVDASGFFLGGPREGSLVFYPGSNRCVYCIGTSKDGKSREVLAKSKQGALTLGPSTDQVRYGENFATYTLSLEGSRSMTTSVILEVFAPTSRTIVAHRFLAVEDFKESFVPQDFVVPFYMSAEDHLVDLRVIWHGGALIRHYKTTVTNVPYSQSWMQTGTDAFHHDVGKPTPRGGWSVTSPTDKDKYLALILLPENLIRGVGIAKFTLRSLFRISENSVPPKTPVLQIEILNGAMGRISFREIRFGDLSHLSVQTFSMPFFNPGIPGDPVLVRFLWRGGAPIELLKTVVQSHRL